MKAVVFLAALAALAACGIDGPPRAPSQTKPGLSVSGEARMGVVGRL
ncbi:hypothetical protein [Paenirhodobacter sp.]